MHEDFVVKSRVQDYQVLFVQDFIAAFDGKDRDEVFVIADKVVIDMVNDRLKDLVDERCIHVVEALEEHKTLKKCEEILLWLVGQGFRKNHTLIALGGGIIQDVTAFVSTVLYRGIDWVFIPTTLLSQADSCIGSKSSINFSSYKNLLGAFYPPKEIFIDANFLKTLPQSEIKSGIGEILHFYLVDGRVDLAEKLIRSYTECLKSPESLAEYIEESLKIKKAMVEIDEFDKDKRNVFNYGHTFGHAIEAVTSYSINHGQAVTMGMDIANHLSVALGYLKEESRAALHKILEKNLPDFRLTRQCADDYMKALSRDKKNTGNNVGCILTRGAGDMFKVQVPFDERLKNQILSYFELYQPVLLG